MKVFATVLIALVVCAAATESDAPTTTSEAPKVEEAAPLQYDGFSAEDNEKLKGGEEKFQFQAEVNRLMDIIINSLYSNREIFIRELISNASDALDKIRFISVTDKEALGEQTALDIRISFNKEAKTLSFRDTGVGMTKEDLIKHLGVVASSGTTKFAEAASNKDALQLIGQFGVGFYSVYLVADRVTVISKNNNDPVQHVWQSNAVQVFTVAPDPRGNTLGRGTEIILHLKDDATEFLDFSTLERIVQRYSSFINFPIYVHKSSEVEKEVPDDSAPAEKKPEDEVTEEDDKKPEDAAPKTKKVKETVWDWKQLNENKAIWTRKPKDVTEEEYEEFYKALSKDHQGPLSHEHFSAEGEIAFKSLLFIPKTAPSELYDKYYQKSQALKLYVRRVLISDEFEDFMPRYLSFIKGVVDSDDLPLNVSRETLSKSRVLKVMSKKITRKALDMLKKMSDDALSAEKEEEDLKNKKDDESVPMSEDDDNKEKAAAERKKKIETYSTFWKSFSKSIKLGLMEDASNKSKLQKLMRFISSKDASADHQISLQTYVDRMKPNQEAIYYIAGESLDQVKNSPFLEQLKKRDFEVLYLVDPMDEYVIPHMPEYEGKKFMSATKENLKFGDETDDEKKIEEALNKHYAPLIGFLGKTYGDKVEKVIVSKRVSKTPCVLVTSQYGYSANMERIMKAQTFGDIEKSKYMISKKTMEINHLHPLIREMRDRVVADPSDEKVRDTALVMFDSALLNSGFTIENPTEFAERIRRTLSASLNVDPDAKMLTNEDLELNLEQEGPKAEDSSAEKDETQDLDSKDKEEL